MGWATFVLLLSFSVQASQVATVECHYESGGTEVVVSAAATADPYSSKTVDIGSRYQVRVTLMADGVTPPLLKLHTQYQSEEGWRPLHIAEYPSPFRRSSAYGFTGRQRVYEARTQSELSYWCDWEQAR
jgi:hypothetical protein